MNAVDKAHRAWRLAAIKGYGQRDHSIAHMRKVDNKIRRLKERYEALLKAHKEAPCK